MRIIKRRLPKGTGMLCLLSILIAACASLMFSNVYSKDLLYKYVRGYYTENSHQLEPEGDLTYAALETALTGSTSGSVMLYKTGLDAMSDTRGVFVKKNSSIPPMRSGRFFTYDDCQGQKNIAVIGSYFEKDVTQDKGQKQITILNKTFDVIGIMGSSEPTRLDTMIWIPLDTAVQLTGVSGDYKIDDTSSQNMKKDLDALHGLMRIRLDSYNGEMKESALEGLTNAPDTVTYVYLAALISFLVSIVFACAYWIAYRGAEVYAKRLNGYGSLGLLCSLLKRYLYSVLPAAAAGSLLALVLQLFVFGGSILFTHLLLGMAIAVLPGLLIVVFQIVHSVLRKELRPAREWI